MSIFPRGVVQKLINESGSFLRPSQIGSLVGRLNKQFEANKPIDAFSAEWELVVLSAFQKIGTVEHEPKCPGSRRPDLHFTSCEGVSFLADITVVSNSGLRIHYPVEAFSSALMTKVHEKGLRGNSFGWELRNSNGAIYRGGPRPRLRLCPERQFGTRIFNRDFDKFLERVLDQPRNAARYVIDKAELYICVTYTPGQEFSVGHYPTFEYPHSDVENRVFDALDDKARQLRNARLDVPMGIILCDGGTNLLQARKSSQSYSIEEILARFFSEHRDIRFVAILTVQHDKSSRVVRVDVHKNPKHQAFATSLIPLFDSLQQCLPVPRHDPTNARLRLEEGEPKYKFCYFGGMTMSGRSVRMSARTLLELLSGRMRAEDFTQHYSVDRQRTVNPFLYKLQNGQLISSITFHPCEDADDDEVTIEFGDPDPILTAFRKPAKTVAKESKN